MEIFASEQSSIDCCTFKTEDMCNELFCFSSYCYQQEVIPTRSASLLTETDSSTKVEPEKAFDMRRKKTNLSCETTAKSKSKSRRIKSSSSGKQKMEEKPPLTDYIHVRARRGQATDNHSLAERVRREKISERMKILQALVPGCEKVTGKAPILDEIINYVESLKNQVEFLSMKLASVSPILYEFGFHIDNFTGTSIVDGNPQLLCHDIQSPSDNFTMTASTSSALPVPGPTAFPQDDDSFLRQNEDFDFQVDLYNMCSFQ